MGKETVRRPRAGAARTSAEAGPLQEVPAASDHPAWPSPVRHRALVVDDNHDAADTLAMMVELMGLDVRRLYEPQAVETEFAAFAPDVVFLDVGMPGRSGYDVAASLRAMPAGSAALLVAVTGWGQPEDRQRSRDAGFDVHVVKPPDFDAIRDICLRLAARARSAPA